jgi:hypothetical protein
MSDDKPEIVKHKNDEVVVQSGIRYGVFLLFASPCIACQLWLIIGIIVDIQRQLRENITSYPGGVLGTMFALGLIMILVWVFYSVGRKAFSPAARGVAHLLKTKI